MNLKFGSTNHKNNLRFYDDYLARSGNDTRKKIQDKLIDQGFIVVCLLHLSVVIGTDVEIGIGSVVMAGVDINSSTRIGSGCIFHTNFSLDHDDVFEDYVHISPGVNLAGTVRVGKERWIEIRSVLSNTVNICSGCYVGAGAVVVKDITEPGTYVGVPVRRVD